MRTNVFQLDLAGAILQASGQQRGICPGHGCLRGLPPPQQRLAPQPLRCQDQRLQVVMLPLSQAVCLSKLARVQLAYSTYCRGERDNGSHASADAAGGWHKDVRISKKGLTLHAVSADSVGHRLRVTRQWLQDI